MGSPFTVFPARFSGERAFNLRLLDARGAPRMGTLFTDPVPVPVIAAASRGALDTFSLLSHAERSGGPHQGLRRARRFVATTFAPSFVATTFEPLEVV